MKWLSRLWAWIRRKPDPFALEETVCARVSLIELEIYRFDADRAGMTLDAWVRDTLNSGISQHTLNHLSKGRTVNALDAAFKMIEEDDHYGQPVLPLGPRSNPMEKKISGHPCQHLNATIPANFTAATCQGVCESNVRGFKGRPCFWGALAAKSCDAYESKIRQPAPLPTKANRPPGV